MKVMFFAAIQISSYMEIFTPFCVAKRTKQAMVSYSSIVSPILRTRIPYTTSCLA